jgi:putative ATP-dependent endonuclease of OLD family
LEVQRRIRLDDFHVLVDQLTSEVQGGEPSLWLEVDVEFPEAGVSGQHASVPPNF